MLSSKLLSDNTSNMLSRIIVFRSFASAAAQSKLQSFGGEYRLRLPEPDGLRTSRLANGLFVASVDNHNPVTRISLIFKAGSRYETSETRGIVHRLRNVIGLSTGRRTAIDFNYHVAGVGALLTSTVTRDHLSFDIQISRRNLVEGFRILDEIIGEPFQLKTFDLEESASQLIREASSLKSTNWPAYTLEKLHKLAYRRNGLANTLYSPSYAIGHHSIDQLLDFAHKHLTTGNATLAATGVNHNELTRWASDVLSLRKGPSVSVPEKAKFYSGDLRKLKPKSDLSVVHIGAQSVGLDDAKGTIAHTVLANVLGTGPLVKWSEGGQTRLAKAIRKNTTNPFYVSASNIGYEGAGIFTLFYSSQWQDSGNVACSIISELKSVANQGVSEKELLAAKNRVKFRLLSLAENDNYVIEDLATQAAIRQSDATLTNDQLKLVDAVSIGEVQQAAKNIVNGKFAVAAIGRLDKTPYVDELISK